MVYNIIILASFCLGYLFSNLVKILLERNIDRKKRKISNNIYEKLLDNIYNNKTVFKSRINSSISLETLLDYEGKINIMYMMDKKDIAIFKNDNCIYTSDLVDDELLEEIMDAIDDFHKDKIEDTVTMMGLIFSREDFEKKFNLKTGWDKSSNRNDSTIGVYDFSDSDFSDYEDFDIDYILDRISEVGIENLTPDEKDFLDNYNNLK